MERKDSLSGSKWKLVATRTLKLWISWTGLWLVDHISQNEDLYIGCGI